MSPPDDLDRFSPAELKGLVVEQWEQIVELLSVITLFDGLAFPLFDGSVGEFGDRFPDATEHAVVLAAVKDASRR